jgi:DNA modification methylase
LRDYGTAEWEGGSIWCEHAQQRHVASSNLSRHADKGYNPKLAEIGTPYKDECGKCGARRIDSQLGLESSPEEYIANLVAVFREVWRVLKPDATLWINIGDSYATGAGSVGNCPGGGKQGENWKGQMTSPNRMPIKGLKPKDLCMMPARLAMALQANGWYLRSEIVWHKPNAMPESVTDRPTKAHEMIFLLTKAERYFYDADAIREPNGNEVTPEDFARIKANGTWPSGGITRYAGSVKGNYAPCCTHPAGRNKRSVWTVATQPYAEAHFATFPEEIPKLCILAGTKVGDTVLDPFAGSGTVGQVALELGRRAILIELNPAYVELALDRTFVTPGFL